MRTYNSEGAILQLIGVIVFVVFIVVQAYIKACKEMKNNKKYIEESKYNKPTLSDETIARLNKERKNKISASYKESVLEMECPNCGAPLKSLYQPCEYCGVRCDMTNRD